MRGLIRYTALTILAFPIWSAYSQGKLDLEDLKVPSMPAATMIGTQFNEISRPKSFKTLEAAIFTNFLDSSNNLTIPNNLALEFSPFMLTDRKNFDYQEYLDDEYDFEAIIKSVWRNFGISIASTTNYKINDTIAGDAIGYGFRTTILNGKVDSRIEKAYRDALEYDDLVNKLNALVISDLSTTKDSLEKINPNWTIDDLSKAFIITKKLTSVQAALIKATFSKISRTQDITIIENEFSDIFFEVARKPALDVLRESLADIKTKRYGLRLDVNYASVLAFPTKDFDSNIKPKSGFWMNLSYTPTVKTSKDSNIKTASDFEFILMGRILNLNEDFVNEFSPTDSTFSLGNIKDLGLRTVYEKAKFSLELEYIRRTYEKDIVMNIGGREFKSDDDKISSKFVLNLNYAAKDNIQFSYSIGRNFDGLSNLETGQLITSLSVNFGLGSINADDLLKKSK